MREITFPALGDPAARRVTGPTPVGAAVVGVALMAAFAVASRWGPGALAVAATGLGAATVVAGLVLHRPARSVCWSLLAVGCGVQAVATAVLVADPARAAEGAGLAAAVLAYPALFVGVAGITSRRPSGWWVTPSTAIATTLVGTGAVALTFTLPYLRTGELPFAAADWPGAPALGDIALAMIVARRVVGAARRNWSWWLLVAGFVAWGNAHAEVGARLNDGVFDHRSMWGLAVAAGPLLVGAAAILPSMVAPPDARPDEARHAVMAGWAWLLTLPPALIVVATVAEIDPTRLWLVGPLVVVLAVAVRRTAGLVVGLDEPPPPLAEPPDAARQ